ncbi:hypothetical protein MiAbW_01084 [Microcystis aeruginosa NIES-4325]|jgi:hypothetical protein|uniref:Uncharacterized protein n=2 Tax=Microcystis aeruginosa TaxID=1126 RepID=A0A5J4F620_MICAE|nr:hypothetical protein N44_03629 [Microcystis aeruginosa NIES-44]GEA26531.1 hypothetical protein MiAbW_01084 [Microcystis aeruginosa NIES-4325]
MPTYTLANTRNPPGAGPAARTNGKPSGKSGVEALTADVKKLADS